MEWWTTVGQTLAGALLTPEIVLMRKRLPGKDLRAKMQDSEVFVSRRASRARGWNRGPESTRGKQVRETVSSEVISGEEIRLPNNIKFLGKAHSKSVRVLP